MSASVNEIRQDAIKLLSQVSGTGTQLYAEDKMLVQIRQAFKLLFKKVFWPEYRQRYTVALDGTNGTITTTTDIAEWSDVEHVFVADTRRRIHPLPTNMNPNTLTGTTPRYWEASGTTEGKPLTIWPRTSTGSIDIVGRVHPGETDAIFNPDLVIKLDRDLMACATALEYASDDGDNTIAIAKLQSKFDALFKAARPARVIMSTPNAPDIPDVWYQTS